MGPCADPPVRGSPVGDTPDSQRERDAPGSDPAGADPAVTLSLRLPHDRNSVTLVRHLARQSLVAIGVTEPVIDDVELALSEACTNVLNHAGPADSYEVAIVVQGDRCELRVIDRGRGFDYESVRARPVEDDAERGRGLAIMEALMDRVELASEPARGTLVTLVKTLDFERPRLPSRDLG